MEKCKKFCVHRSVDAAPAQLIVIEPDRGPPVRVVPMSGREKPVTRLTELSLARRGRLRRADELPRKRLMVGVASRPAAAGFQAPGALAKGRPAGWRS